ncbi:MAG: hypothetical protein NVS2B4_06580 [Ramlibacter sp.]
MEQYQNKDWGMKQRQRSVDGMRYLDSVLAQQPFFAGEKFSMADITLFAGLGFADFAKIDVPADCKHLTAWCARMAQRPSMGGKT